MSHTFGDWNSDGIEDLCLVGMSSTTARRLDGLGISKPGYEKYSEMINVSDKTKFNDNLKTINKQIKQIENLVNEFSDFARMPKPIFKENNLVAIVNENIKLLKEFDQKININFTNNKKSILFKCDSEQIGRVFLI